MTILVNVLWQIQTVTLSAVIIIGIAGFVFGFLLKIGESKKSSKKLSRLQEEKEVDRERIDALNERIREFEKKNSSIKSENDRNIKKD